MFIVPIAFTDNSSELFKDTAFSKIREQVQIKQNIFRIYFRFAAILYSSIIVKSAYPFDDTWFEYPKRLKNPTKFRTTNPYRDVSLFAYACKRTASEDASRDLVIHNLISKRRRNGLLRAERINKRQAEFQPRRQDDERSRGVFGSRFEIGKSNAIRLRMFGPGKNSLGRMTRVSTRAEN